MIKFFRKIRQNMLREGKIGKYLTYAIGEIFLVVIGILIALQISNWNEQKKIDEEVLKALTEIRSNLISDSLSIHETRHLKAEDINIQYRVINELETKNIPYDSIESHLGRVILGRRIVLVDNGYQLMKKYGLELLKDQDLRNELITYYTKSIKKINDDTGDDEYEFRTVYLPYIREHFLDFNWGQLGVPLDYEHLMSDQYFLTSLKVNIKNEESTLKALQEGSSKIQEILPTLDKALLAYE